MVLIFAGVYNIKELKSSAHDIVIQSKCLSSVSCLWIFFRQFHKDCIDRWLIHEHPTCPVDGTVVWNPLTANLASQETRKSKTNRPGINNHDEQPQNNQLDLSGLGVTGVSARTHDATPGRRRTGVIPGTDQGGSGGRVDGLSAEFQLMGLGFGSQQKASSRYNSNSSI